MLCVRCGRGLDFSFSGLKTATRYHVESLKGRLSEEQRADVAASVKRPSSTSSSQVHTHLHDGRAQRPGHRGGVACNSRLRTRIQDACDKAGLSAHLTPARYCTDNAAMIGGLAAELLAQGKALEGEARLSCDIHVTRRPKQPTQRKGASP